MLEKEHSIAASFYPQWSVTCKVLGTPQTATFFRAQVAFYSTIIHDKSAKNLLESRIYI